MASAPDSNEAVMYAFGPFTIDAEERLLRREREVESLPPKVVETLLVLLESRGELVSKEELMQRVWPGAFVEENSLTQNISRLRRLLSADFPDGNAILTVPKRGYRLGLEVQTISPTASHAMAVAVEPSVEEVEVAAAVAVPPQTTILAAVPKARRRRVWAVVVAAVLLMVVPLAVWKSQQLRTQAAMNSRTSVAILGFQDLSGGPTSAWVSTALSEMMYSELGANQQLRLIPNLQVAQMRQEADIQPGINLAPFVLSAIRERLNCDMVVTGHYLLSGGKIRVDVVLQDARSGEMLGTFSRTDADQNLLSLIALTGQELRRRLGEQGLSAEENRQMVASVAANPDALRAYSQGMDRLRALDAIGAKPFLEEAIRLEPEYPLAHAALSSAWSLMGFDAKASEEAQAAFRLSEKLSREDRLAVEARYYEASNQWPKAVETYAALWRFFPDNMEYGLALSRVMISAGKALDAMEVLKKLNRLPAPQSGDPRIALTEAQAYSALSQFAESEKAADRAISQARACQNLSVLDSALIVRGNDATVLGDQGSARAEFAEARSLAERLGDRATAVRAIRSDAEVVRQQGDLDAAKRENNDAIAVATEIGDRHDLVNVLLNMSMVYRPEGNLPMQKQYIEQALKLAREIDDKPAQAGALLNLGNVLNNMGDPDASRVTYQQCMAIAREIGDKTLLARVTGNLGILEYTHGRLESGKSLIEQALKLTRETGDKSSVAYKLGHYATVLMYQDRMDQARAAVKEKCEIESSLGEKLTLASCQIVLAEIDIEQGRARDAIGPLNSITSTYKTVSPALPALIVLAEAQLETGNLAAATNAVNQAQQLSRATVNQADFHIPLGLIAARVQSAQGQDVAAMKQLQGTLDRANALKLLPMQLRARLTMAEIKMKMKPAEGIRLANQVEKDARQAGYLRIAANAQKAESRTSLAKK